ncbi:hypothetical protein [Azospirillum halopraeferens]|uniref:hypothetical protein n=1 Tax=Azospirillum halopraeferens TaxID=34010 RepID=UPI0004076C93|nr:hypothetical protein [Azospirillum halopraeferens]
MLFRRAVLDAIAAGRVTLAFRRWRRPTVRAGGTLRTAVGVLAIDAVDAVEPDAVDERDARAAGYAGREALLDDLRAGDGTLYRIALRPAGPDPRWDLRSRPPGDDEAEALRQRLERLDRAGPGGPWTGPALAAVADHPGRPAAELAAAIGLAKDRFKAGMRRLKDLGLVESLAVGYRLSPRGRSWLDRGRLNRAAGPSP